VIFGAAPSSFSSSSGVHWLMGVDSSLANSPPLELAVSVAGINDVTTDCSGVFCITTKER